MHAYNSFKKFSLLVAALALMSFTVGHAKSTTAGHAGANDYKFKVHNNTKHTIKKVLVSEDGKTYGYFDIGDGIEAGATEELIWAKSTDNGACEWHFKAVFDNDEESEPVKFDFCEKDLVLEFS
jgi:hypothetical protein